MLLLSRSSFQVTAEGPIDQKAHRLPTCEFLFAIALSVFLYRHGVRSCMPGRALPGHTMLKATEQVAWSAKLVKFARGRPEHSSSGKDPLSAPSNVVNSSSGSKVAWQHFSGHALCIRLLFSRPSEWEWSKLTQDCQEITPRSTTSIPSSDRPPMANMSEDRQFNIVVEWERSDIEPPASQKLSQRTAQTAQPVILVRYVIRDKREDSSRAEKLFANLAIIRKSWMLCEYIRPLTEQVIVTGLSMQFIETILSASGIAQRISLNW